MLYLNSDELRLKSFSSSSRGGNALIKIEIEVRDLSAIGYALSRLQRLMEEQKAADRATSTANTKPKLLALPKPGDN